MGIVEQYFLQLKSEKRRLRRAAAILTVLSFLVAVGVAWNLRMTGITIANGATCGVEEHQHSAECLVEQTLICGNPEIPEEGSVHIHAEECYRSVYQCGLEEHIHAISCYADETVDLESSVVWEATLPERTEQWTQDVVQIAQSQLGCGESERNFVVADDGETRNGITRYGQWYGNPYGDWSAMFILFCLNYAEVPEEAVPWSPGVYNMMRLAEDAELLTLPDENIGTYGNLLFLDTDENEKADRAVLVTAYEAEEEALVELGAEAEKKLTVIGGDVEHTVQEFTLAVDDPMILGYINLQAVEDSWTEEETGEETGEEAGEEAEEEAEEMPAEPAEEPMILLDVEFPEDAEVVRIMAELIGMEEEQYSWQWQYSEDGNEPWIDIEGVTGLVCQIADTEEMLRRYYRLQGRKQEVMLMAPAEEAPAAAEGEPEAAEEDTDTAEEEDTITSDSVSLFSIVENNDVYTIDMYALPVADGERIEELPVTSLGTLRVNSTDKRAVKDSFDPNLGDYVSAYFGTETVPQVDNIASVWRAREWSWYRYVYALAYQQTNGTVNDEWKTSTDRNISLYLRYEPKFTVTFASDGFESLTERVSYQAVPTLTEPGTWTRENYTPLGWSISGDESGTLYTYAQLMERPITEDVTYTAQWDAYPVVTFESEWHNTVTESVAPGGLPVSTNPGQWSKENHTLLGWTISGDESGTLYTYAQLMERPVTEDVTYTAQWKPYPIVTFVSEHHTNMTQMVVPGACPTLAAPFLWTYEDHSLVGWIINGNTGTVYTSDEIMGMPVYDNVTYTAQWKENVTVSFNLGEHVALLETVEPIEVPYGTGISLYPTPVWKTSTVAMAFDGWYLDSSLTNPVPEDHIFTDNTILYAKWSAKDDAYFIYFMDYPKEDQPPLVLKTVCVTGGKTASPYAPTTAPSGMEWNGQWYLDEGCTNSYSFSTPISEMTDYLTGANGRDLYLYPGMRPMCRAIFVTYGSRIDPVEVHTGGTVDLDLYVPEREGYTFTGWTLKDGTPVSGVQRLMETTTYYAAWDAGYVSFEAFRRIENANDTGMTQAGIIGTWYARAGSQIRVNSTYTGEGTERVGTHEVVCVLDGVEYPVYTDEALTQRATLPDVHATYFLYNNTGTTWTDEVNWDDVFISGELPYSTRPISAAGDTIINFDYMRVRRDIVFTIGNSTDNGGFIDIYKLWNNGLLTGTVIYDGTVPTGAGQNVSAHGVAADGTSWSYTAAANYSSNNYYTLHNMKYGERIYEVYPVGGSWLTARGEAYHQYIVEDGALFSSRRQDLTSDFFTGSGRALRPWSLVAQFEDQEYIALMYAVECLEGQTPDFTLNGVGYKVDTELCEVVKHTGYFSIKDLEGCEPGINSNGTFKEGYYTYNKYYLPRYISAERDKGDVMNQTTLGGTSVYSLFAETYWPYYARFNGMESIYTLDKGYIFYYNRLKMNIQFNFAYDSNGDGSSETVTYSGIPFGERIEEYQFGVPEFEHHPLLQREGYQFAGWLDENGFVLEAEDWASMVATGDSEHNTMIFVAKWEKISDNIVEYYEDRSAEEPFESHFFDDGAFVEYPTMDVYPDSWVWQYYGEGDYTWFDWDVPMYGEYGVKESREINGEMREVNVIRVYGRWDDSNTKVIYDPNAPEGGIPGTAPTDPYEYTVWQSEVPVAPRGDTENADPDMIFAGWKLEQNDVVYQPGDHVPVRWPRVMKFVAQWAKPEDVVHLRYHSNGGTPEGYYPNETGLDYERHANAGVWDNRREDDSVYFTRPGYTFTGWNTDPDGSGTAYAPDSTIVLTEDLTTLYAQWEPELYTLSVFKVDSETGNALMGAEFTLYKYTADQFQLVQDAQTTGVDGHIVVSGLEANGLYKLVEEKPPGGYAIIAKEICFRLTVDGSTISVVFCDSAGNPAETPGGVSGEYNTGSRTLTLTVKNLRGYALPATGGPGTSLFMLCGLALMLAPLVYGFRMRRRYERRFDD